jgi:hypothetical protein
VRRPVGCSRLPENVGGRLDVVDSGYPLRATDDDAGTSVSHWPSAPGLSWAALMIGLMPVVTALVRGSVWGAEPTFGLALACVALAGLGHHYACAGRDWVLRRRRRNRQTREV